MRSIDYFDRGHDRAPGRAALIDAATGERFTFAEVKARTERIAVAMHAAGFSSQQPAALYGPNSAAIMIALLAIWRANGQWVPVNTRNAIDANAAYLNYVRCGWLFYHSSMAADVALLRARVPSLTQCICLDRAMDGDASLDDLVAGAPDADLPDFSDPFGAPHDVVGLFPTGGTTGPSKGVVVTNLGWGTMLETLGAAVDGRTDAPVSLVVAPITHAAGPVALGTLALGATQVILPGFDAPAVLRAIAEHRVTHMYLPPTALYGLLDAAEQALPDVSSLRVFILVGSPVSPEKLRRAVEVFGPCMCQAYGQVESPMITTWLPPETVAAAAAGDHPERLASCGRPTRSVQVAIMDDDGRLLPDGQRGEIVVRGVLVSKEYFELPAATAEARQFGWHHTGDVAYRDADGYYYIVDRKKDMVVTGGFNVFTAEVEAAITELAAVRECAVIGIPHDKWGEQVHAIVVAEGTDEQAVIAHAKARLGGVKAPKSVSFVDAIPRTAAGKMDKNALRAGYWRDGARMVN
ncbi:MAG: AMP-dependent synthetase [Sphingomonas sp. 66-10]|mgnify:FL=1|uniref:AMP-binding protein n=1 Tax=Sphingomonas sp. 66-10 TaxID=1895848 RepID=UPI00092B578C|nr:AMP-binding protein [Sphingomonas sp. 66-10]OJU17891.1 MAG: AMP-dependent synthetase [Sphingomonas sp. 66-10]